MKNNPEDLTPLQEAAASMHELFNSYVQAGFSRREALELLKSIVSAHASKDGKG